MKKFTTLAGVPVHYDRDRKKDYGTRGRPYTFAAQDSLIAKLEAAFAELWGLLGRAEIILSAGAYTDKPGWHGRGLAFDLDGIIWPEGRLIARHYPNRPRLYLLVEAVLRRRLGTILNYHYNEAHRCHWHIQDDGKEVFTGANSQVYFLQAVFNAIFGEQVKIDGCWGPQTRAALCRALDLVGLDNAYIWGVHGRGAWREFLQFTAQWPLRQFGKEALWQA